MGKKGAISKPAAVSIEFGHCVTPPMVLSIGGTYAMDTSPGSELLLFGGESLTCPAEGRGLLQCSVRSREAVEWSLPKWLLPDKSSSREHELAQVHFTWAKLLRLLQFCFLELIAQGYDGEGRKGHFSQGPERNGFYKMDGANQGKVLMNILCFGQLNKTHITKITTNHLHQFEVLTKPYVLYYPVGCSPQVKRKILPNSLSTYYRAITHCSLFLFVGFF